MLVHPKMTTTMTSKLLPKWWPLKYHPDDSNNGFKKSLRILFGKNFQKVDLDRYQKSMVTAIGVKVTCRRQKCVFFKKSGFGPFACGTARKNPTWGHTRARFWIFGPFWSIFGHYYGPKSHFVQKSHDFCQIWSNTWVFVDVGQKYISRI